MKTKILAVRQGKVINPVLELHAKDVRIAELQDALEFSERVAEMLAAWEQNLNIPCMETAMCERHPQDCPWCRIKYARLAVEEEMDAERK